MPAEPHSASITGTVTVAVAIQPKASVIVTEKSVSMSSVASIVSDDSPVFHMIVIGS